MKLKYLLRGAGLGIFAAGLIAFLVTLGGNKISDEEVIKRAKELGYASQEEVLAKINSGEVVQLTEDTPGTETGEGNHAVSEEILPGDVKTSEETSEEKTSEVTTSEEKTSEEKKAEEEEAKKKAEEEEAKKKAEEEAKKKAEEEEAKKKAEEEAKKKAEEEEAKKKAEEEAKKQQATGEQVTITVKSGDYSDTVAKACEAAGLVKSASDFDNYLCNNGYSGKIAVGDHKIAKGSDYETIAKKLCGR